MRRLYSWLLGRKIGQVGYCKANPHMIGPALSFLPSAWWTEETKKKIYFRYEEYLWTGYSWQFNRIVETPLLEKI